MEDEKWWRNSYYCEGCDVSWDDCWSCCCDDECPECGKDYTPVESVRIDKDTGEELEDG